MIDLAVNNLYLLGAALVVGVVTGRWAFSAVKAAPPASAPRQAPAPEQEPSPKQEDQSQS